MLANGPLPSELVKEQAIDAGYSKATIRRAKAALEIEAIKEGKKQWLWQLPDKTSLNQDPTYFLCNIYLNIFPHQFWLLIFHLIYLLFLLLIYHLLYVLTYIAHLLVRE